MKSILHFDIENFFISCERLANSELNRYPVIVGGRNDRGVVVSCSEEAKFYNVKRGMPIKLAIRLCPEAKVLKGDFDLYTKKSLEITEIVKESAPVMEKSSMDEFFLDISGMDKFIGTVKWSNELISNVKSESGLIGSYGLSVNKTVSKIANEEGRMNGQNIVSHQKIKSFLNPLPIRRIPKVGSQTANSLHRIGVRKIQTLAEMPVKAVTALIGEKGKNIWYKANGIDDSPVVEYNEQRSISTEESFERDTLDIVGLKSRISKMVEQLCFELRQSKRLTSMVSLRIRYTNFDSESKSQKVQFTSRDDIVLPELLRLFDKLYQRRMRLRSLRVSFSGLVGGHGHYQIDLFNDSSEMVSLYQAIDKIKGRYGEQFIQRGTSIKPLRNDF